MLVPLDGANVATRRRLRDFATARVARTTTPQGPRQTMFGNDLVGSADRIVAALHADPVLQQVQELRVELLYELPASDYRQILETVATRIAPALGWQPQRTSAQVLRALP